MELIDLNYDSRYANATDFARRVAEQKMTIDQAGPEDVRKRKAKRTKQLREQIKSLREQIANAERELAEWENT